MGYRITIPKIEIPVLTSANTGLANIILPGHPKWEAEQEKLREYIGSIHGVDVYSDPAQKRGWRFTLSEPATAQPAAGGEDGQ